MIDQPVFRFLGRARVGRVLVELFGHERLELLGRVRLVEVVNEPTIVRNGGVGRHALAAAALGLLERCADKLRVRIWNLSGRD